MANALRQSGDSEPTFANLCAMIKRKMNEESPAKKAKIDNSVILISSMAELYSQGEFVDVTIQIGQRQFQSHRLLLASLSYYFHELFGGDSGNMRNPAETIITMDDLDVHAFETIVNFMYKGEIDDDNITDDNIIALMETANFLRLRNSYVGTKCAEYLERKSRGSRIENAVDLFKRFRILSNGRQVANVVRKDICLHLGEFKNNATFRCISYEELKELLPPGCPFWMYNQDGALNFLVGWIHYNRKGRKQYFNELMKMIDVKKVSKHWISFLLTEWEKSIHKFEVSDRSHLCPSLRSPLPHCPIGVFTFIVENFSKLKPFARHTSPLYDYTPKDKIMPVQWQIYFRTESHWIPGCIDFGLEMICSDLFFQQERNVPIKFQFSILAQQEGRPDITQVIRHEFNVLKIKAESSFALVNEVVDPNRGLIKDDMVIFQAKILDGVEDSF